MRSERRWSVVAAVLAVLLAGLVVGGTAEARSMQEVEAALERAEERVEAIIAIPDDQRTFENTIGAMDDIQAHIELDTNMTQFLAYVSTDAEEREIGLAAEVQVGDWLRDMGKNEALYEAVRGYAERAGELGPQQARLLDRVMRDFRRDGMDLTAAQRQELTKLEKEADDLGIEFSRNIREDETIVPLTRDELIGVPSEFLAEYGDDRVVGDVYLIGMTGPEFFQVLGNCENETTRKKVWLAYKRRGGKKNVQTLERMIALRAQAADLLGYANAAEFEIEVRMAKDAATVEEFYRTLRPLVREKARLDHEQFVAAKRAETGDDTARLFPWDFFYYQTQLKKNEYAVDPEAVREYFPLEAVMDGLFSITQSLYGLEYRDVTDRAASMGRPLWHDDAMLYEVIDTASGEMLGSFYLDLHPRDNKYSHAAQWGLAQHKVWSDGTVTKPVAALVCNFSKPTAGKPSLMTHDEVETFFHEFGHCLHTILSESTYWRFSGTGVERDFVEAPSQMFENWVWDADVLATFARHYETGEPLPAELLEGMIAARHLGSGMLAEHQFYYGLVDFTFHTDPDGEVDTTAVATELLPEIELYDEIPGTHYHAGFGHFVNYRAGYYGYQWSLVYASDMFQRFKELGMLDPDAGMYYRKKILSRGGTLDGLDLVRDYLGREPDMSAYLEHLGLETDE